MATSHPSTSLHRTIHAFKKHIKVLRRHALQPHLQKALVGVHLWPHGHQLFHVPVRPHEPAVQKGGLLGGGPDVEIARQALVVEWQALAREAVCCVCGRQDESWVLQIMGCENLCVFLLGQVCYSLTTLMICISFAGVKTARSCTKRVRAIRLAPTDR